KRIVASHGIEMPPRDSDGEPLELPPLGETANVAVTVPPPAELEWLPERLRIRLLKRRILRQSSRILEDSISRLTVLLQLSVAIAVDSIEREALDRLNDEKTRLARVTREGGGESAAEWRSFLGKVRQRLDALGGPPERAAPAEHEGSMIAEHRSSMPAEHGGAMPAKHGGSASAEHGGAAPSRIDHTLLSFPDTRRWSVSPETIRLQTECLICHLSEEALFELFADWQYRLSTEGDFRSAFADRGGLCPLHTWRFEQIASPVTISLGFAPLLEKMRDELVTSTESDDDLRECLGRIVTTEEDCPVCEYASSVQSFATDELLALLTTRAGRQAFESSFGLCLPHARSALARCDDAAIRRALVRHEIARIENVVESMRNHSLKREAGRRALVTTTEETAWREALRRIAGSRNTRISVPIDSDRQ
ncbi:MAG TPA: DUF6062 family protein, partial [Spirochaetia bacterium]